MRMTRFQNVMPPWLKFSYYWAVIDDFFFFFVCQHYYQYKRSLSIWSEEQEFPWQIEHLVRDTIAAVRPKLQMYNNLEEAQKAVTHLNNQIVAKAIEVSTWFQF